MFRYMLVGAILLAGSLAPAQNEKWTPPPKKVIAGLICKDNALAAMKIRSSWGQQGLETGKQRYIEETTLLAAAISEEPVTAWTTGGDKIGDLTLLDDKGFYALARDVGNVVEFTYQLQTNHGKVIGSNTVKIEYYPPPPESTLQEGVPEGDIHPHIWTESKIFPGTERGFLFYIPKEYDSSKPASLIVFQDGPPPC